MADINKVWLSGLVITTPVLTRIREKTPLCTFTLQVNERFQDRCGNVQIKPNLIKIECLGRNAETAADRVKEGKRFVVEGYIRQDRHNTMDDVRVRGFAVYEDVSAEDVSYRGGLEQALKILMNSQDLKTALSKLEVLINSSR